MKNNMLGLIFAENPEASMGELTSKRSLAAVPFGGRYRIIDFILSSMVNSHIINVGITTSYNFQSLADHLGTGKAWELDRKNNGLFMLPSKELRKNTGEVRAGVDIIHDVTNYLRRSQQEYVLASDCNTLCNMNYDEVFRHHLEQDADITLIYHREENIPENQLKREILLDVKDGVVEDMHIYPAKQKTECSYMHQFLIRKDLLMDLVDDAKAHGKHSLAMDVFLANLDRLKVCTYEYTGCHLKVNNVKTFFEANLALLDRETREELFGVKDDMPVYTKVKDTIPTKYGKNAEVSNSIVADGCVIEGTVKNCILFRGVHIGKGASVENCILMQKAEVQENCMMENVIFDKEVVLRSGKKLVGQETYPMIIGKRSVI